MKLEYLEQRDTKLTKSKVFPEENRQYLLIVIQIKVSRALLWIRHVTRDDVNSPFNPSLFSRKSSISVLLRDPTRRRPGAGNTNGGRELPNLELFSWNQNPGVICHRSEAKLKFFLQILFNEIFVYYQVYVFSWKIEQFFSAELGILYRYFGEYIIFFEKEYIFLILG